MNSFDFQKDVIEASHQTPVLVDFWASWCAPCRMLSPVLEKLDKESGNRWKLVKISTEEHPQIAMQYQVSGIPAVKLFSDGKPVAEFVGVQPEHTIKRWLDQHLPTESKKAVTEALNLIKNNQIEKAIKILKYAVEQDDTNLDAKITLALLIFENQPDEAIELVSNVDESHSMFDKVAAIRTLNQLLNSEDELKAKTQSDNSEALQLYLKGISAFKVKDYDTALASWIEVIIIDKKLENEGARKACVALFRILGNNHELTQKYHRKFTSSLY